MNLEKPNVIEGEGSKSNPEKMSLDLQVLAKKYECEESEKPRWCVRGKDRFGNFGVKYWIKPVKDDEFTAFRIAKLENELGGEMRAVEADKDEYKNEKRETQHRGQKPLSNEEAMNIIEKLRSSFDPVSKGYQEDLRRIAGDLEKSFPGKVIKKVEAQLKNGKTQRAINYLIGLLGAAISRDDKSAEEAEEIGEILKRVNGWLKKTENHPQ